MALTVCIGAEQIESHYPPGPIKTDPALWNLREKWIGRLKLGPVTE